TSLPAIHAPIPTATARTAVMTAIARYTPAALSTAQGRRPSGVASSISSRPPVSSVAQPPTSIAAAKPTTMKPSWPNASRRKPPAVVRSKLGRPVRKSLVVSGDIPDSAVVSDPLAAAITSPKLPRPMPQARPEGSRSPKERQKGSRRPSTASGRPGVLIDVQAPRSRRADAPTPPARRPPVVLAGQRHGPGGPRDPAQLGAPRQRRHGRRVAVQQPAGEQDEACDPGRRGAADEQRERERHRARRERGQADPQGEAGG